MTSLWTQASGLSSVYLPFLLWPSHRHFGHGSPTRHPESGPIAFCVAASYHGLDKVRRFLRNLQVPMQPGHGPPLSPPDTIIEIHIHVSPHVKASSLRARTPPQPHPHIHNAGATPATWQTQDARFLTKDPHARSPGLAYTWLRGS